VVVDKTPGVTVINNIPVIYNKRESGNNRVHNSVFLQKD
jgi:hypothetical protein